MNLEHLKLAVIGKFQNKNDLLKQLIRNAAAIFVQQAISTLGD
jgi:hypothetical protein